MKKRMRKLPKHSVRYVYYDNEGNIADEGVLKVKPKEDYLTLK